MKYSTRNSVLVYVLVVMIGGGTWSVVTMGDSGGAKMRGTTLWHRVARVGVTIDQIEKIVKYIKQGMNTADAELISTTTSAISLVEHADTIIGYIIDLSGDIRQMGDDIDSMKHTINVLCQKSVESEETMERINRIVHYIFSTVDKDKKILADIDEIFYHLLEKEEGIESALDTLVGATSTISHGMQEAYETFKKIQCIVSRVRVVADQVEDILNVSKTKITISDQKTTLLIDKMTVFYNLMSVIKGVAEHVNRSIDSIIDILNSIDEKHEEMHSVFDEIVDTISSIRTIVEKIEVDEKRIADQFEYIDEKSGIVEGVLTTVLSKIKEEQSQIDSVINTMEMTEMRLEDVLSSIDTIIPTVDNIGACLDTIEPKTCLTESVVDFIEEGVEVLEEVVTNELSMVEEIVDKIDILIEKEGVQFIGQEDIIGSYFTITQPGTYCLAESILGSMVIMADEVVLDLNGYIVMHENNPGVIVDNHKNIVVKNGWIKGNGGAIKVVQSTNVMIKDIKMVEIESVAAGIYIDNSFYIFVELCQIEGGTWGVLFDNYSAKCVIKDCIISNSAANGIEYSVDSCNNHVSQSEIVRCFYCGIKDTGYSNLFSLCIIDACAQGISVSKSSVVDNCIILNSIDVGVVLVSDRSLVKDSIILSSDNGVSIIDMIEHAGLKGNCLGGNEVGVGIFNAGNKSSILNNMVYNYGSNYSGMISDIIKTDPNQHTRFWTNISQ